jgi:Zn-dependent protease/CBS domain-containing protein
MKNSFRLARVFGIDIEVHFTFFLLLVFFFMMMGAKGVLLVAGVFFFVTVHELCHSLAAKYFGIKVQRIILLPIGGVASMSEAPSKPLQELVISLAGPLSNVAMVILLYYPVKLLVGAQGLEHAFWAMFGREGFADNVNIMAYVYWLNLFLAGFNLLPAFPMDGGRVLRALLSYRMDHRRATAIAVRMGHIFALFFAYFGIVHGHIFLVLVAVFIYMSASGEQAQVNMQEAVRTLTVQNVLAPDFVAVSPDTLVAKMYEIAFHSRQEDFPVTEDGRLIGFIPRYGMIEAAGTRDDGRELTARDIMKTDTPSVKVADRLLDVQRVMAESGKDALPVEKDGVVVGVVTANDLGKAFYMTTSRKG